MGFLIDNLGHGVLKEINTFAGVVSSVYSINSSEIQIDGIHGISHLKRTSIIALNLHKDRALGRSPDYSKHVIMLSALCHDIGRTNDGKEPLHSLRGVRPTVSVLDVLRNREDISLDLVDQGRVCHAVAMHNRRSDSNPYYVDLVRDADILELLRLDMKIDTSMFHFSFSENYIEQVRELQEELK